MESSRKIFSLSARVTRSWKAPEKSSHSHSLLGLRGHGKLKKNQDCLKIFAAKER